jgi:hypothetical protein
MDNSGAFTLGDFALGPANTYDGDPLDDLDGLRGFTAQVNLQAGAGTSEDATAAVYIATSIDQGTRWCDVAVLRFAAAGGTQVVTVEAESTPLPLVPSDGSLDGDSNSAIVAGIMGDRLKAKIVTTGTFAGQTLCSIDVCVR